MRPAVLSGEIFHFTKQWFNWSALRVAKSHTVGEKKNKKKTKKKKLYYQKEHRKLKICHLAVLNVSDKSLCDCDNLLD